jgi:hypothetical protein
MRLRSSWTLLLILLACAALVLPWQQLVAQETRGSIVGRVTDQSGAVLPGATVEITNKAMGTKTALVTNDQGFYQATYLLSGLYRIEVQVAGFKKFVRDDVEVRINDRIEINISLEIGELTQTVSVTGETPLLSNTSASLGQVVDGRRITELPLAHGNPYQLIGLSNGVVFNRDPRLDRSYEPTHIVGYTVDGSRANRSDLTIDGAASTATANAFEVIATYVPPGDIIQEFKIQTATFDASFGSTEGGVTNISIKSGTNNLHGTAYYSGLPPWTANDFYANRVNQPIALFHENRWGGSAGGPFWIPGLYNGKNKTFWLFGYEGVHDTRPRNDSTSSTVPSAKMKTGDFSELLAIGPQYQIYNPFATTPSSGGRYTRQKFDGNVIPQSLINPVGKKILSYWPDPRFTPSSADGTNNNYDASLLELAKYYNWTFRVDHTISDKQRMFVRGSAYTRNSTYDNYLANTLLTGSNFQFFARNGVIDDVYTINPTTVLNVKFGYSRFIRGDTIDPTSIGFDLTTLGFPAAYNSAIPDAIRRFPAIAMSGYQSSGVAGEFRPVEAYSVPITLQKAMGKHFLKIGMEFRAYRETDSFGQNNQTGQFNFDGTYTKGPIDNSTAAPNNYGQSVAALLLGVPTSSSYVRRAASYAEQSTSWGFYLQDDWKVTSKLTLNIGLREEFEGPLTERYNRSVRGLDYNVVQSIATQVIANYTASPTPEVPASQFKVNGGLTFSGVNGQPVGLYHTPKVNLLPRFGFAYQFDNKTVVRGGYGMFLGFLGERRGDVVQTGFTRDTNFIPSNDSGLTFLTTLSNPYPNGILEPIGSSLGVQTYLGQAITFFNTSPVPSNAQRWQIGFQRELPHGLVVEATYVGNKGTHIEINRNLNVTPQQYLSKSPVRDQTTINYLTALVKNPFYGVTLPAGATSTFTASTIARERLLRPFPQFDTVNTTSYDGYSWYHGMQLRAEKRFSHSYSVIVNYGWSKFMQATELLNQDDPRPYRTISDYDAPHRLSFSAIWELPFNRLTSSGNPVASRILKGWQLSPIYQYQSGAPIGFGNLLYYGNFTDIALPSDQRTPERWFNTSGFETATAKQLANNVRTFPLRFSGIRADCTNDVGLTLLKNTKITEGKSIQFKTEALNLFNHPLMRPPSTTSTASSFGSTVGANQVNYARRIQLSVKFIF